MSQPMLSPAAPGPCLDLGAGGRPEPGFIHLDQRVLPDIDIVADLRAGVPIQSGAVAVCRLNHTLEHLPDTAARQLLVECWRVLKIGGIIHVHVPNWDWFPQAFLQHGAVKPLEPFIFGDWAKDGPHLSAWTGRELHEALRQVGFESVRVEHPDWDLHAEGRK